MYQPKTGRPCTCKRGIQRDNCPRCEGTGQEIDFRAIHEARRQSERDRHNPEADSAPASEAP